MPMTASLGCGTVGRQHHQREHQRQALHEYTWVSRVIPEDKPSEQELLGEFYNSEVFEPET
jgi:sulfoacetaldehyde dehydrogenase